MLVLICGDREWQDEEKIRNRVSKLPKGSTIIHGACRGADLIADKVSRKLGFSVHPFHADWKKHGLAAGPIRNREMLDKNPTLVLAFHPDLQRSKGTLDTLIEAAWRGIPVEIIP